MKTILAYLLSGNIFASILGTFFGNPLTFPFIAAINVKTGNIILDKFSFANNDLSNNESWEFDSDLTSLTVFEKFLIEVYFEKFIPYAIGGIICGVIIAFFVYLISKPLIYSYQKRKSKRKKNKISKNILE